MNCRRGRDHDRDADQPFTLTQASNVGRDAQGAATGRPAVNVRMRKGLLLFEPEQGTADDLAGWASAHAGQVFRLRRTNEGFLFFQTIGPEEEACRVPMNITSRSPGTLKMISNFAEAHFVL